MKDKLEKNSLKEDENDKLKPLEEKGKKRINFTLHPDGKGGYVNKTGSTWVIKGVSYPSE